MKKKLSCALAAGLTIFFFAACDSNTYADYASMEKSQLQGSLLMPISLEQLEQHSDCIVQGVLQNDAETCVTADPRFEWAMPSSGATKSTLTVTTILKGDGLLSIVMPFRYTNLTMFMRWKGNTVALLFLLLPFRTGENVSFLFESE